MANHKIRVHGSNTPRSVLLAGLQYAHDSDVEIAFEEARKGWTIRSSGVDIFIPEDEV